MPSEQPGNHAPNDARFDVEASRDADQDALQRLAESGSDLTQPMEIDFHIAFPDETSAEAFADVASISGYRTEIYFDDDIEDAENADEPWTCQCSKVMIANLENLQASQIQLNQLAQPQGGYVDGWGSYGNVD